MTTILQIVNGTNVQVLRYVEMGDPQPVEAEGSIVMSNSKGQGVIEFPGNKFAYIGWTEEEAKAALIEEIRGDDEIGKQLAAYLYSRITDKNVIVVG